jgi:hypothetical protein
MSDPSEIPDFVLRKSTNRISTGQKHNPAAAALRKLEAAEAPAKPRLFSVDSVRALQDFRRDKNLTQKQLDQACSFPAGTINLLEGRRVEPSRIQLQRLNNMLGRGLTLD